VVARALLGKRLVHRTADDRELGGRIVESEAYVGASDLASHASRGRKGRAAIMYGSPGIAYVYLIYGVYHCFNAVAETEDVAGAVLVRAVETDADARDRRASGPGLVCRALEIDRALNGADLTAGPLTLEEAPSVSDAEVSMGPRIGVAYAGAWAARPYRFWLTASAHVSRPRRGAAFDPAVLQGGL
jgi:DNA-3-methyladenine glycosylase